MGAVLDSGDILANEHLKERGMITTVEHPTRGVFYHAGLRGPHVGLAGRSPTSPPPGAA